jgi:hypothetical protein
MSRSLVEILFGPVDIIFVEVGVERSNNNIAEQVAQFEEWYHKIDSDQSVVDSAKQIEVGKSCRKLPSGLRCYELLAEESELTELPDIQVLHRIALSGSPKLRKLPDQICVDVLMLRNCPVLEALPERLEVFSLDISGCTALREWPSSLIFKNGRLGLANCNQFTSLPSGVRKISELDVSGCTNITELPEDLEVTGCIHLGGSGLSKLPEKSRGVQIRWNGVLANDLIAFRPESITAEMVLGEQNIERRRIMLERMGMEKFFMESNAEVLHQDRDPGGERRLLRMPIPDDEDLVCLSVICPSTERRYIIRVPPTITNCRQAAAWIAGFDDPTLYKPLKET